MQHQNHAPDLLNQFLVLTSRDAKSDNVLWSASPVNKYETNAINNSKPVITRKLPNTNFCWLDNLKLADFNFFLGAFLVLDWAINTLRFQNDILKHVQD